MMKKVSFEEALRGLGHIYVENPAPVGSLIAERIRHAGVVTSEGVQPLCGENLGDNQSVLGCSKLWLDVNCTDCREMDSSDFPSITKRSVLLDCIHSLVNIEQLFLDCMWWNFHNPHEQPINPDPDGFLALEWEQNADQVIQMIERARPTMQRHSNRFGWPETIGESK